MAQRIDYDTEVPEYALHTDDRVCGFFGLFRFLSNFFLVPNGIQFEGLTYPSVEHAYQAAKWPENKREEFTKCSSGQAKRLGKKAPNFDKAEWEKNKVKLMTHLVFQKFAYNQDLKEMLLATGDAKLEEWNSWGDEFWGCNEDGEGENKLGQILMGVRDIIRENKL